MIGACVLKKMFNFVYLENDWLRARDDMKPQETQGVESWKRSKSFASQLVSEVENGDCEPFSIRTVKL